MKAMVTMIVMMKNVGRVLQENFVKYFLYSSPAKKMLSIS